MARKKKPPFWSRVRIQSSLFATVVMNANVLGLSLRKFCTPGFNCHGCAWATCACPIGVMAYGTAMRTIPVVAISFIVAIGIVFGRLVCAFVCPFGFFQDWLHRIPSPKLRLPRWMNYGRYFFLVTLVFVFPYLLGLRTSGYLAVETEPEEVAKAELDVTLRNTGSAAIQGGTLTLAYLEAESRRVIWQEERRFDDTLGPGEEKLLDRSFEIPVMPLHSVNGTDVDTLLIVTVPAPLEVAEKEPTEQGERMTKVVVRLRNLDTEPVHGVELDLHCVDEETKQPIGEPVRHDYPDLTVEPGASAEVVFFTGVEKPTDAEGNAHKVALLVTSPQSEIVTAAPAQLYYCKLCPTGTLTALVPTLVETGTMPSPWSRTGLRLGILLAVLVMMVLFARPFCRLFCPLGAIYSLFNRMAFVTMKADMALCNDCGNCSKACPLDLDVPKELASADCIQCGDCIPACTRGGITRAFAFPGLRTAPASPEGPKPEPTEAPA